MSTALKTGTCGRDVTVSADGSGACRRRMRAEAVGEASRKCRRHLYSCDVVHSGLDALLRRADALYDGRLDVARRVLHLRHRKVAVLEGLAHRLLCLKDCGQQRAQPHRQRVRLCARGRWLGRWCGGRWRAGAARWRDGRRRRTFFLSSECPFLAPTNLSFMICGRGEAADAQPRRRGGGQQKGHGRRPRLQVLARREGPRRRHVGGGGREWCTATARRGILFSALPVRASPVPRVVRGSLLRKSFQCLC